jgi:hypothetical protein
MEYHQEHLVRMANQIAGGVPSREDVAGQVSHHMQQFWTPVMLKELSDIAADKPDCVDAAVHAALAAL